MRRVGGYLHRSWHRLIVGKRNRSTTPKQSRLNQPNQFSLLHAVRWKATRRFDLVAFQSAKKREAYGILYLIALVVFFLGLGQFGGDICRRIFLDQFIDGVHHQFFGFCRAEQGTIPGAAGAGANGLGRLLIER